MTLAKRCEQATGPDRELDEQCALAAGYSLVMPERNERLPDIERWVSPDGKRNGWVRGAPDFPPRYTASIDAAMTLLPSTAVNFDLFDYIGEHKPTWGCHFHDRAQLMGVRAAKEQIARMQKGGYFGSELRGAPRIVMEKAIAEHFIEFMCMGAVTPALAVCAAALKARAASADRSPEGGGPEEGRHAKHESAVAKPDAQPTPVSDPISNKGER